MTTYKYERFAQLVNELKTELEHLRDSEDKDNKVFKPCVIGDVFGDDMDELEEILDNLERLDMREKQLTSEEIYKTYISIVNSREGKISHKHK